jgi:hypothetical protein
MKQHAASKRDDTKKNGGDHKTPNTKSAAKNTTPGQARVESPSSTGAGPGTGQASGGAASRPKPSLDRTRRDSDSHRKSEDIDDEASGDIEREGGEGEPRQRGVE